MARVSIPDMEATGHTLETAFSQIMLLAESAIERLSAGHRKNDLTDATGTFFLTSSLTKYVFYNWLINNILYLCVT